MSSAKNKVLKAVCVLLLAVFLVTGILLLLEMWDKRQSIFPTFNSGETDALTYNGEKYILKENIETFLVLGLDKTKGDTVISDAYNNDKQADFLMLFVFDNENKKCSAININRDSMAEVNVLGVAGNKVDTVTKQIALAHTYGNGKDVSCRNTADSVSKLLLDTKVNHYISLTLDSVAVLNDAVGGVEVEVLDDFNGIDSELIKGEKVTLKGEQALKYIRTRYGLEDNTNSTRMVRQEQFIKALHKKLGECIEADEEFIVNTSLELSELIVSDRSVTQLQELTKKFNEYEFNGILSFEGESKLGKEFMEFYPDKDSVEKIVIDLFYKKK